MKTSKYTKGLALVEFTILLPFLLLMVFSILEIGRAFILYNELEKQSRDSARYLASAIAGEGSTTIYTLTQDNIDLTSNLAVYGNTAGSSVVTDPLLPGLDLSQVTITLNSDHVQVEIIYPFQPVLSEIPSFFSGNAISLNFNMTSSYTMRVL